MSTAPAPFKVVIAGSVAGLEGVLALRELAGDKVSIEMPAMSSGFEVSEETMIRSPLRKIVARRMAPHLERYEARCA